MIAKGEGCHEQYEVSYRLVRLRLFRGLVELEEELGEEDVPLAGAEVLEEGGRVLLGGVLEEAEDGDEHLDDLEWRQLTAGPLHVLNAERDATFVVQVGDDGRAEAVPGES